MKATLYMHYDDALNAAREVAAANNGYIAKDEVIVDDRCISDYGDCEAANLIWSGEVSAIMVRDAEQHEVVGYFAYWL